MTRPPAALCTSAAVRRVAAARPPVALRQHARVLSHIWAHLRRLVLRHASRIAAVLLAVMLALAGAPAAQAHETTRSYVTLTRDGADLTARFRTAFRDIEVAVWIDEDLDGALTWGEVQQRLDPISEYLRAGLALEAGGACVLHRTSAGVSLSGGVDYLDLGFAGTCPDAAAPLTVTSRLFTEIDPDHRLFLSAVTAGASTTSLLSAASPTVTLTGDSGGVLAVLAAYLAAGVSHLLGGPDHILFLLALMLPAVCAQTSPRRALIGVAGAITGFTLAHALTLTAALTNLLRPPPALIEALIAATIILTAIDNVRPFLPAPRPAMAAFFGIIHGFGFATALGALDLTGSNFVVALIGFNLGIEVAQLGVVLVTMPVLYVLGAGRWVLWTGSLIAGAAGAVWLWVRLSGIVAGLMIGAG